MDAVKSARVHLVMATDSVLSGWRTKTRRLRFALKLKSGELTHEQVGAIQRLVAGAVDGLKPSDVAIIDADSNESLAQDRGCR